MRVLVYGQLVPQLQRKKAGPNLPTSSLSAGNEHIRSSHAFWVLEPLSPRGLSLS